MSEYNESEHENIRKYCRDNDKRIEALEKKVKAHCEYYSLSYDADLKKELAELKEEFRMFASSHKTYVGLMDARYDKLESGLINHLRFHYKGHEDLDFGKELMNEEKKLSSESPTEGEKPESDKVEISREELEKNLDKWELYKIGSKDIYDWLKLKLKEVEGKQ